MHIFLCIYVLATKKQREENSHHGKCLSVTMDDLTVLSNWQYTMLEIVYLNQLGTSYWHCSRCSSLSYKASPGVPHYSEVCLVLTTLRMEKRRSALANKDKPCSKQMQKGNIKGHLGDEKGNCCTRQYTHSFRYIYTHKNIHSHINLLYILSNTCYHSTVRPESLNAQSLYSQSFICLTTNSSCCSRFSQVYQPCIINSGETPC